ncbi:hypothetical protein [uncultured Thiodictyon sp.]|uniref:hypothetical protein n=1 Tax=uncultured Thiodictyon sp. TaxID=1846217 RepID=UPI0025F14529|nr:hypothetical protein [uncultured Thiodictyon sp.]
MPAKSAPAVPPEAIAAVGQHTINKLSERAIGRLTYQIGVGASGVVYLTVTDNEGGGYFSREPVALDKIETVLATHLATGASFATSLLRRCFVNRSNNNSCFLAAALRHAGLIKAADLPNKHVCAGDWATWQDNQRHRLAQVGPVTVAEEKETPKPVEVEDVTGQVEAEEPPQEVLALAEDADSEPDEVASPPVEEPPAVKAPGRRPDRAIRGARG